MSKTLKMASSQQQNVKPLNVQINITTRDVRTEVLVTLRDPKSDNVIYTEGFEKMLPNVPLETYVQYTFGMYNATICKNESENA